MKSRLLRLSTIIAAVLTSAAAWAQPTVSISVPGNAITADSGSVAINLAALGNENTVSFTLTWDPAVLTYVSSALGASVPTDGSATLTRNSTQTATGKLGVLLGLESGTSYTAGAKHILTVNFTRASQVASTTIAFVDTPTARRVIDKDAVAITAAVFVDATISTAPPTAPTISTQPQNQTVVAGAMAMFSVVATGNPTPTSFVWKKASTTLADGTAASGAVISGATTAMIHLAGVAAADAGSYTVTVGNGVSPDVTSSAATLTINPALSTTLAVGYGNI